MMSNLKIELAAAKDAKGICNVINKIIDENIVAVDKKLTIEDEKKAIASLTNREALFVLKDGNICVGFQSLKLLNKDIQRMKHVGEVDTYLLPNYRGKGFGELLFRKTLQFAKLRDYEKLVCFVRADNIVSLKFHKRLGFREAGRLARQIKPGRDKYEDEIILELFV